jgi:hypothetical protein
MSTEYPGLPRLARSYCRAYLASIGAWALFIAFTGAVGALLVLALVPEALWLYIIAAVSLVLHYAALFIKDVWQGEYEPGQTTFSSPVMILALVIVVGVMEATVLLLATGIGYIAGTYFGASTIVAFGIAAYYPVLDTVILRRGHYTPGGMAMMVSILVIDTVINLRQAAFDVLPVVGKRRRFQS